MARKKSRLCRGREELNKVGMCLEIAPPLKQLKGHSTGALPEGSKEPAKQQILWGELSLHALLGQSSAVQSNSPKDPQLS